MKIAFKLAQILQLCRYFPSARSSISVYQTIVNPSIEIIPSAAAWLWPQNNVWLNIHEEHGECDNHMQFWLSFLMIANRD